MELGTGHPARRHEVPESKDLVILCHRILDTRSFVALLLRMTRVVTASQDD